MRRIAPLTLIFLLVLFSYKFFFKVDQLTSAPPTSVKDTLSSSQLSYFARLGTGNTTNDTLLRINVDAGTNPSSTTNNLFVGDTIGIGMTNLDGILTKYVIADVGNTAQFQITTGIGQSNAFAGAAVIATRSAIHTLTFTPQSSVAGGAWQFLIKATSRAGEVQNDGIPDQQGFDLGQDVGATSTGLGTRLKNADVSCPWGATASVGTTTSVTTAGAAAYYHVITCDLSAGVTNPVGVATTMVVGRDLATGSQLINPAPALSHVEGQANSSADTYVFYVRHLDGSDAIVNADTIQGRIAVVEAVRVTATVDPTITFIIDNTGVGAGSTACGNTAFGSNASNVTATAVPFGSLTLAAFNNLAQRLQATTNAQNGYVVTVYENMAMREIGSGTTIPNTDCDGACSYTAAAAWATDTTNSGWGYTVQNLTIGTTVFSYPNYKAFGVGAAQAQNIITNTSTPTQTESAYVCYRLVAATTQEAGNYENKLIYTATATF